jgi:hypothetical protein
MKQFCDNAMFVLNLVCALITICLIALVVTEAERLSKNEIAGVTSTAVAVVR